MSMALIEKCCRVQSGTTCCVKFLAECRSMCYSVFNKITTTDRRIWNDYFIR